MKTRDYLIIFLLLLGLCTNNVFANSKTSGIAIQKIYEDYSLKKVKLLAEKGDANAQYDLSERYSRGIGGVQQDWEKAIMWVNLAAKQNNSGALNSLGYFYNNGFGVKKNIKLAFKYYQLAAKQGHRIGIFNVGFSYMMGYAGYIDQKKAAILFKKASDLGYIPAKVRLGYAYDVGAGVKQDKKIAFKLYKEAALKGEPNGQFNLGGLYYMGEGTPINNTLALMWRYVSYLNGNHRALLKSDSSYLYLLNHMTKIEILKSQKLAKECYESHYTKCKE